MISLGSTEFYIGVPSVPRQEFERYSTNLFDEWDEYVESVLKVPDYSLELNVEEGSIKGGGRIAVAVTALYLGIGQYGSFISGIQTIQGQMRSLSEFLVRSAASPFSSKGGQAKVKRYGG